MKVLHSREMAQGCKDGRTDINVTRTSHIVTSYVHLTFVFLSCNADKTKCMVMSRDQNAERIHSVRMDNSSFKRVEEFKYLGTNLTNQNSIAEEIKSRLRSGNACFYSVQNLLSSRLLSKKFKDQHIQNYNFARCFVWV